MQSREKLLTVLPGRGIELERHRYYDEIWVPNAGIEYLLEIDDGTLEQGVAEAFAAFCVPRGKKHLFRNTGSDPVVIYEIQIGTITDTDKEIFSSVS